VPTSVETTSARGLDLTPENISKPDLKQVGFFFIVRDWRLRTLDRGDPLGVHM
jgi:hypothetical protein